MLIVAAGSTGRRDGCLTAKFGTSENIADRCRIVPIMFSVLFGEHFCRNIRSVSKLGRCTLTAGPIGLGNILVFGGAFVSK